MDEVYLSNHVPTSNTSKLSLPNHVDSFVSSESSLSTPETLEMLAGFDSPSNKSVILLHYILILKVLHRAMLAALWKFTRLFQFSDRLDVAAILIGVDDSRRLNVLSLHDLAQKPFCYFGITSSSQQKV